MNKRLWLVGVLALAVPVGLIAYFALKPPPTPDPLGETIAQLRSGEPGQRSKAATALAKLKGADADRAVPALVAALDEQDPQVRASLTDALASLQQPGPVLRAFREGSPGVRKQAAIVLGKMTNRDPEVVAELRKALTEADPNVLLASALALRAIRPPRPDEERIGYSAKDFAGQWTRIVFHGVTTSEDAAVIPPLVAGLSDEDEVIRSWSAGALADLVKTVPAARDARPALEKAFFDGDVGLPAGLALARLGREDPSVVDFLLSALASNKPPVRARSAYTLKQMEVNEYAYATLRRKDVVDALVKALADEERSVRSLCADTLGQIGPPAAPAVPALLGLLHDPERGVTLSAVGALGRIGAGGPAVVEALLKAAVSPDRRLREEGVEALGRFGAEAVPGLRQALESSDEPVRRASAEALGNIGYDARAAVPDLQERFVDTPSVRVAAAQAVWRIDPVEAGSAVGVLASSLLDPDAEVSVRAAETLAAMGTLASPAVESLKGALMSREARTRCAACQAVRAIGPFALDAVPALARIAEQGSEVAEALGAIGPTAGAAVPALEGQLDGPWALEAAVALSAIEPANSKGLPVLLKALRSKASDQRDAALLALARLGPAAREAVPVLVEELGRERYAPWPLKQALVSIGPEVVPPLTRALAEEKTRRPALEVLAGMGPAAKGAVPALASLLTDKDYVTRVGAAEVLREAGALDALREGLRQPAGQLEVLSALAEMGPGAEKMVEPITELLAGTPTNVRVAAARALGKIGPQAKAALPRLREQRGAADPHLRVAIAGAIGRIEPGDREALAALRRVAEDPESKARQEAVVTLGRLGPGAREAVGALKVALKDPSHSLRESAAEALGKVGSAEDAVGPLVESLGDREQSVRRQAARALAGYGPSAREAVPALRKMVRERDVEDEAATALGRIGEGAKDALPELAEAVFGKRGGFEFGTGRRKTAEALALWRIGRQARPVVTALIVVLQEESSYGAETEALDALAEVGPEGAQAVPAVARKLFASRAEVRRKAAEVLGKLGPAAKPALLHLQQAVRDRDERVRQAAEEAVKKVGG